MNFYKRHLGDYAKHTNHLSMLEHGAYTLLLDRYYASEKGLPKDDVYRITRSRSRLERAATDAVLAEFFTLESCSYTKTRVIQEIKKANLQAETNRVIAERRWKSAKQATATNDGYESHNEPSNESLNESYPVRSTNLSPSQTPDSRQEQERQSPPLAADFKTELYARWKAAPGSGGGAFLGALFRDYKPELRVLEAIERALDHNPSDLKGFVKGLLNKSDADDAEMQALFRSAV